MFLHESSPYQIALLHVVDLAWQSSSLQPIRLHIGTNMVAITIKSLPAEVHERLKLLAARNRRSLQNEIIFCLEHYAERSATTKDELLAKVAKLHTELAEVDHRIVDDIKRDGRA